MRRPGWLAPTILGTAVLAVCSGAAQFGVTAVLGDVAVAFGEASQTEVARTVGLSATTLGIGLALIRLAGAGSLYGSALADRWGRRRVLIGSVVAGLVLTLAATVMPTWWTFVMVIALARPSLSTTNALSVVVAAEETSSRDRTAAIALVGAAYALGSGLVSVLRGVLDTVGFRTVLALTAVPVLLVPLLSRVIEEPPPTAVGLQTGSRGRLGGVPRALLPRLLLLVTLVGVIAIATGPAFTYLFVYGENVLGVSRGFMAGLILAAGPVGLVGLLVGRAAADRRGRRVTAATATVAVVVSALVSYSGSVPLFAGGYLAAIGAGAAFGPASGALLNELMPTQHRGTANGWAAASGVLGAVIGLGSFGVLADALGGFDVAARWLFLPLLPSVLLYVRLPETRGLELDDPTVHEWPPGSGGSGRERGS